MNANGTDDELEKNIPKRQQAASSDTTSSPALKFARTAKDTDNKNSPVKIEPSAPLLFQAQSEGSHDEKVWLGSKFAHDS